MMRTIIIVLICFIALPAFKTETRVVTVTDSITLQPQDERAVQDALPKAKDTLWATLGKAKITLDENKGTYNATLTDEIKKLDGQKISISGFVVPLEATETFSHFLLSKRTPTCFFCPPGEPNEIIEVFTDKPVPWDDDLVVYEGTFGLTKNADMGIFFKMTGAVKK